MSKEILPAFEDFAATEKLYDYDAYETDFTASVTACRPTENPADGKPCFAVFLDRTLFFPEEGGQTCDRGILTSAGTDGDFPGNDLSPEDHQNQTNSVSIHVFYVAIDEKSGVITHYCDGTLAEGSRVRGQIDFAHRFSNMQNHTGEHIFSGLVHSTFGYNNVGFHLSDDIMTMDYDGELSQKEIAELEYRANEVVWRNARVNCTYPTEEELARLDYRSKKELTGRIRIVEVEGVDICACCAPHVKRTGEVGVITVLSAIRYKGGTRVSALCGSRGYKWLSAVKGQASGVSNTFSVPVLEIAEAAKKQLSEKKEDQYRISLLQQKILGLQLSAVPADEVNVLLFTEASDHIAIRNAVNTLTETHPGYVLLLSGEDGSYRFILGSRTRDCKAAVEVLRKELSAKGGGTAEMVQGSMKADEEAIRQAFFTLSRSV